MFLELFSEEIPSRMQARASEDLRRLVCAGLSEAGLDYKDANVEVTPRRLALHILGLARKSPDISERRKGPRIDAPAQAIEGFLRANSLDSVEQCEISEDKKGRFYTVTTKQPGKSAAEIISRLIPEVVRSFPWEKSMRWGSGKLRWVRPLHSIVCIVDGKPVKFTVEGIESGNSTYGHRFMASQAIQVASYEEYRQKLAAAYVELSSARRQDIILGEATKLADDAGLELVDDPGLLVEAAGLVEWPQVLIGDFDENFLEVPAEALIISLKKHQKCFALRNKKTGALTNRFIMVANLVAEDGGKAIVNGNERVIRARLSDARFFWEQDCKRSLAAMLPRLQHIIFHAKIGSQAERTEKIMALSGELAVITGADKAAAMRAAELAKADLVSDMVGEFPALQGIMGGYYARQQGEDTEVAEAIATHYQPQGPSDSVPNAPVSVVVAIADKLNTLADFWAIDEKPTGSKDPYALRRAALGVVRLVLENNLRLPLKQILVKHGLDETTANDLLEFFADRLRVYLRDLGARHDLLDAVFGPGNQDDLLMIVRRVDALAVFLSSDDGANLLSGIRRAANILRIEEKRDGEEFSTRADKKLFAQVEEKNLYEAISNLGRQATKAMDEEDFTGAMHHMAGLRQPVDVFFDSVTVNDAIPEVRKNRLCLLNQIRQLAGKIADFSRIE
jgi:glycyl-tRNA synthetase beta chain